jgi:hypothetical protein
MGLPLAGWSFPHAGPDRSTPPTERLRHRQLGTAEAIREAIFSLLQ